MWALEIFTSCTSRRSTSGWTRTAVKSTAKKNKMLSANATLERFTGPDPLPAIENTIVFYA
jgi:hypothetical protein